MKKLKTLSALLIATTLITSGCHSYYDVHVKQQALNQSSYYLLQPPLYSGDKIRYQLKDGQKGELTVSRTDPQNIYADDGSVVPVAQISSLKKRDISNGKTAAAVGGGAAATVVIVAVLFTAVLAVTVAGVMSGT